MKIVVLLQGVNNLVTLCKMNLVKGSLLLSLPLRLCRQISLTRRYATNTGNQRIVIKGGEVLEHFAFGVAQTARILLRPDHKIRVASVSKITLAIAIILVEEQHCDDVSELAGELVYRLCVMRESSLFHCARMRFFRSPQRTVGSPRLIATAWEIFFIRKLKFRVACRNHRKFSNERFDIFMVNRIFEPLAAILAIFLARYWQPYSGRKCRWSILGDRKLMAQKFAFYGMLTHADKVGYLVQRQEVYAPVLFRLRLLAGGGAVDGSVER